MSYILHERCFIKVHDKYIAMALYQPNEDTEKRWGILAPFSTIGTTKNEFLQEIESFSIENRGLFLKNNNGKRIMYGEPTYMWYLHGLQNAKPIEDYLVNNERAQAYCVLRDIKGRHRNKMFSTTEELSNILENRREDIVSIGLTQMNVYVQTEPKVYVITNGLRFIKYEDENKITYTANLDEATFFQSEAGCIEAVNAIGNSSFYALSYKTAKTYQAKRYVIAAEVDGEIERFVKSIAKLNCEFCDSAAKARRFYKKQGEEQLERFVQKYPENSRLKYRLVDMNKLTKEKRKNDAFH